MLKASQASPDCKNPPISVSGFVAATGKGHSLIERDSYKGEDQILISHVANALIRVKVVVVCVLLVGKRVGFFDKKYCKAQTTHSLLYQRGFTQF